MAARPRVVFQAVYQPGNLVDGTSVLAGPAAPLRAVHGAKLAVFIGPFVPDADAVVFQKFDVGLPFQEPEQFVNDGAQVELLGGQARETVAQVIPALPAEHADGARPGPVLPPHPMG